MDRRRPERRSDLLRRPGASTPGRARPRTSTEACGGDADAAAPGRGAAARPTTRPAASSNARRPRRPARRPTSPLGRGPRHGHRPVQAAGADRRGRHGRRLHGRADRSPVRRKVALKVIKPGMDTRQVIARFEAERQALALMDHPNIAQVLDAGTTDTGRPYFVMELVHGVPITEYCDDNRLTPRQRLELFVPVCQAVQHAHQKGIIHRDLKPSNVLVTLLRRQAGAQGDRLRRRQGDRAAADRADAVHRSSATWSARWST